MLLTINKKSKTLDKVFVLFCLQWLASIKPAKNRHLNELSPWLQMSQVNMLTFSVSLFLLLNHCALICVGPKGNTSGFSTEKHILWLLEQILFICLNSGVYCHSLLSAELCSLYSLHHLSHPCFFFYTFSLRCLFIVIYLFSVLLKCSPSVFVVCSLFLCCFSPSIATSSVTCSLII